MNIDWKITVRSAAPSDIPLLLALQNQSATSAQWSEGQYKDVFSGDGPSRLLLAAEVAPCQTMGFLLALHVASEWELENIVVAPAWRHSGIGCRLLTALIETAKQTNSEAVFLEVRESNFAARGLYEKCGFQQTGRRKSYYSNPLEDAIIYRLSLR